MSISGDISPERPIIYLSIYMTQTRKNLKPCYFCDEKIDYIDYKDKAVYKFLSPYAKILPRRKTGTCAKHQRKVAQAAKRARYIGFMPFSVK